MRKCEQREHILKITKMNPGIRLIYKMPTGKNTTNLTLSLLIAIPKWEASQFHYLGYIKLKRKCFSENSTIHTISIYHPS